MGKGKKKAAGPVEDVSDEEAEVTAGVGNVKLDGKAGAAPFNFNFGGAPQGGQGQFAFNFAGAGQGKSGAVVSADGEDDDEDEEEHDHVEEFLQSLPESQQECVKALEELDEEVEKIQVEFRKEFRALQRKYEALEAPIFTKRSDIVSGAVKPADSKIADGTGIPDFWLGAMRNCACISENVTEKDEVILKFLENVKAITLPEEEGIGFRLEFTFKPNEHFTNTVLTKTYFMADGDDDPVLEKAEGTTIDWAAGKNVTVKTKKKKQRNKNGKGTRTVTKTEPCESFFNFFSPPKIPTNEDMEMGMEEMERRQQELEADYDMGISFREKLVPHAVKWFTGEADDEDDYDDEGEEDFEEGEEEGEEDDEDEDEAPPKGRGGRGGGGGGKGRGGKGGQEECKQQ